MELLGWIITGGVAAACIKLVETITVWVLNRRAIKKDGVKRDLRQDVANIEDRVENLTVGQRAILHDRIKFLGKSYLRDGSIDLDDRKDLITMHEAYHLLKGNGNLDVLMNAVLKLPLSD